MNNTVMAGEPSVDRALIVVAKEPSGGRTKTRLSPPLSGQEAADLYRHFLLDTLDLMHTVEGVQPIIAYLPAGAEGFFRRIAPPGFAFAPQEGADLGERLDNVLRYCLRNGYRQAVVMDSDSPTLPVSYVQQAFQELDDPSVDVVLGPCDDGGYYLIGVKSPCSALFQGIVMSTSTVTEETLRRAREQGLRTAFLPVWYDVDTPEDLRRLMEDLRVQPEHLAMHTRASLADAMGRQTLSVTS
jgi:rSAM/selenodomain-associated transferase 1